MVNDEIINKLIENIESEDLINKLIDNVESKLRKSISGASFLCAVNDVINEFLVYTNRDKVPEQAYGLVENMIIKRYLLMNDLVQEDTEDKIKSYSQGNISVTYRDNIQKDYELSDAEICYF